MLHHRSAARSEPFRSEENRKRHELKMQIASLSKRERDVLDELWKGKSSKEIAAAMDIGYQTVAKHKSHILKKLGVSNHLELVILLRDAGL